jgi:hypothetical protein
LPGYDAKIVHAFIEREWDMEDGFFEHIFLLVQRFCGQRFHGDFIFVLSMILLEHSNARDGKFFASFLKTKRSSTTARRRVFPKKKGNLPATPRVQKSNRRSWWSLRILNLKRKSS